MELNDDCTLDLRNRAETLKQFRTNNLIPFSNRLSEPLLYSVNKKMCNSNENFNTHLEKMLKSSNENIHDKASTQNKTQYNSNTKISAININDRTPLRNFDDSILIHDNKLLGNDLFTDINLLNIEMKLLHTPRELKDKMKNFDFSDINVVNDFLHNNDKSTLEFEMNKSEIKNQVASTKANSKNKDQSKNTKDKSTEKKQTDNVYKKINLKHSVNTKKALIKFPNQNISPIPNSSRNVKNLSQTASKKNTIDSIRKEPALKNRRVDKFLNNNCNNDKNQENKKNVLLKLDFKNTLRSYNINSNIKTKSPSTTKNVRNKSSDMQMHSQRTKSTDRILKNKTISASPKKKEKNLSYDYLSENIFVKQLKGDSKNVMKVIDKMFGPSMENYDEEVFYSLSEADKVFVFKALIEGLYNQKKQINDLEKSINNKYKNIISSQEEKITYLTDEINSFKDHYTGTDYINQDRSNHINEKKETIDKAKDSIDVYNTKEPEKSQTKKHNNISKLYSATSKYKTTSKTPDKSISPLSTTRKNNDKGKK